MASLQTHHYHLQLHRRCVSFSLPPNSATFDSPTFLCASRLHCPVKLGAGAEIEKVDGEEGSERPPFDINLAVVLAGFAFEAYSSPPGNVGRHEVDAADCKTVYLSESFIREIYDGELSVKLKKGLELPAMDPWGTSDPYVIMTLDGQVVKSKVKWGTKEPTWNEDFSFNIKLPPSKNLQVAAWDANLVSPHKRMGNASISLEDLCDGNLHEVLVELEGMGGGGKVLLEVNYKTFDEIDEAKKWWSRVPFVSDFLRKNGFEPAMKKMFAGSDTVQARQFVEYAFGQLKSFNNANLMKNLIASGDVNDTKGTRKSNSAGVSDVTSQMGSVAESFLDNAGFNASSNVDESSIDDGGVENGHTPEPLKELGEETQSDKNFWKKFANEINQNVAEKFGLPVPEKLKWDGFDILNRFGLQLREIAEASYIESGLATPEGLDVDKDKTTSPLSISMIQSSLPDIKKATRDLLKQTDSVLGTFVVLTAAVSESNTESNAVGTSETKVEDSSNVEDDALTDPTTEEIASARAAEEMKELFSSAESAMEAWAMLATSLGHPSFIKSEFEKLCFLDNATTDTQVAIWRDSARKRLVIAFRGTEQSRWKDLRTDLMVAPTGLNPERIGGDFKQEVQVHSGFLRAYDSVRIRIVSLMKLAIGYFDDIAEPLDKWHVYITGHSLGGALSTLLALELSSSQLAKRGLISVTMYNFGSPRVGNKVFAEIYNEKVKDSWRVVNHRDIIPTIPRLMGYCHVAQPVYLATGDLRNALGNMELSEDGYQADVIGEYTPDVLVGEFMKGEKELIEKILQTEINIFRSVRDGTALMQHMEDFYYITLLENVRSNYQVAARTLSEEQVNAKVS
ncbi:hypothetical protein D8674_010177 [Pyrus ussuriensis x Pyrus communis]|uniref:C2 domain-containing protein n=1 Tax=Pyrus ussuriensis x Pyrus communis TaxID=2448454 RepID=A0A5N5FA00_9ROSA|nr:hypothetical protein D8674_010177 [Pyrus ussuriensis x Pyrus communis]